MSRTGWRQRLRIDPVPILLASGNAAIQYFARRDLRDEEVDPATVLWGLPEPSRILRKQQSKGSWKYPRARLHLRSQEDYDQLETFRALGILVEKYGFTRDNPAIETASDYLFSCQTTEGDFRGITGHQYTPYYSGAIIELLVKAGYAYDSRIERGFRWLLSMRQDDGGWSFPLRTVGKNLDAQTSESITIPPDRSKPFSHLITGMVLRAFAAHPIYGKSEAANVAASLLASRFFKRDPYPDRNTPDYWSRVSYPFWFTDIISALDSISRIGLSAREPRITKALEWLANHQNEDGTFRFKLLRMNDKSLPYWITLALSRVLKRFQFPNSSG